MTDDGYTEENKIVTSMSVIAFVTCYSTSTFLHLSTPFATKHWPKRRSIEEKDQIGKEKIRIATL